MSDTPQESQGTASHDPDRPAALLEFMATGWAAREETLPRAAPGRALPCCPPGRPRRPLPW